ncbi:hypothetical protein GCM10007880_65120 [Mesorhizobium amorphae]|nr:hypothetical protein GCM10007880_65120 [Mesorhizobium amorphae]
MRGVSVWVDARSTPAGMPDKEEGPFAAPRFLSIPLSGKGSVHCFDPTNGQVDSDDPGSVDDPLLVFETVR